MASSKRKVYSRMVAADTTAGRKSAGLAKLGRGLSGRGSGSADAKAGRGAANVKKLQNAVATSRGGGQGKASPMKKQVVGSMMGKTAVKTTAPKRPAAKKTAASSRGFVSKSRYGK